jgi:hypothetical protein
MMPYVPHDQIGEKGQPQPLVEMLFEALSAESTPVAGRAEGSDLTPIAATICRQVCEGVEQFLKTAPPLPQYVLGFNHKRLAYYICECVGLTEADSGGIFGIQLRGQISSLALQYYYIHPTVQEHLQRAQVTKESKLLDDIQRVLAHAKRQFTFDELQIAEALSGGWSGSIVIRVYYREHGSHTELGVFKCTDDKGDFQRERDGQSAARCSWMAEWVEPRLYSAALPEGAHGDNTETFVLLTPLAFPPSPRQQVVPTLYDLIHARRETHRCKKAVAVLGSAYATQFGKLAPAEEDFMLVRDLFLRTIKNWAKPYKENAWNDNAFWHSVDLPIPRKACFQDGERVLWNPLWLIHSEKFGGAAKVEGRFTEQHGDLNARNVMLPIEEAQVTDARSPLRLIDFEKWTKQSAVLDLCWLGLAILEACAPLRPSIEFWFDLPERFVCAVVDDGDDRQADSGNFELGLELVGGLFGPLHENARRISPVMENSVSNMLCITLGAAALAFAYYSARALDIRPGVVWRADDTQFRLLWAMFGFRVAALCLNRLETRPIEGHPGINMRDVLESLFSK